MDCTLVASSLGRASEGVDWVKRAGCCWPRRPVSMIMSAALSFPRSGLFFGRGMGLPRAVPSDLLLCGATEAALKEALGLFEGNWSGSTFPETPVDEDLRCFNVVLSAVPFQETDVGLTVASIGVTTDVVSALPAAELTTMFFLFRPGGPLGGGIDTVSSMAP